jgi:hypothetical protein
MSRLDSAIRRLQAQRACIGAAARLIEGVGGPVLELGLGNGRTYDHLRETLTGREIFVFDRHVEAHPDCVPDPDHMIVGDFRETLPAAGERIGRPAALAHCDIGSGRESADADLAADVARGVVDLVAPAGIVVADQRLDHPLLRAIGLPEGVAEGRYFMYRRVAR